MLLQEYPPRVRSILEELGIPTELISARALPVHPEARELVVAEYGENGREHLLVPAAAAAWRHITAAARSDSVNLQIASAFRSFERQAEIVREKLEGGLSIDAILLVSAPPGLTSHRTCRRCHHVGLPAFGGGVCAHRSVPVAFVARETVRFYIVLPGGEPLWLRI